MAGGGAPSSDPTARRENVRKVVWNVLPWTDDMGR